MSKHPAVLWAQRSDKLFLTIELADAQNPVIKIEPDGIFSFSATAGEDNAEYTLDLEFFGDLDKEKSKIQIGKRLIFCVLVKKETGHWDKLLKTPGKAPPYVRVDWEKWVDEDEETSRPNFDNFDLSSMDDMSKFDLGGGADSDDDDGAGNPGDAEALLKSLSDVKVASDIGPEGLEKEQEEAVAAAEVAQAAEPEKDVPDLELEK